MNNVRYGICVPKHLVFLEINVYTLAGKVGKLRTLLFFPYCEKSCGCCNLWSLCW